MFSVIIPAYNAELFVKNAIESVLSQTVGDFEIIVIDDGSKDNTRSVVESIKDDRIRYIYKENGGVSSARNAGIQNAKGEYVCFLDADDLWKTNHLEVVSRLACRFPECNLYLTGYEILLHDGNTIKKGCPVAEDVQSDNVFKQIWDYGYFMNTNCVACKRSVFDTAGLFEVGVKNSEDDDMWYRMFSYFSAAISGEITTVYVRENSRATASKTFVEDWVFLSRVSSIMASEKVSDEKKHYLRKLLEQRKQSAVRMRILNKDKKNAWKKFMGLNVRLLRPKKYIVTLIALLLPSCISIKLVNKRDKAYYHT
ncbi:MAG: glycosyltransferase family 2 protein [Clostridia bacterium]|nr:glycosyltransferase family 2 protein [Clostridia bacterium]